MIVSSGLLKFHFWRGSVGERLQTAPGQHDFRDTKYILCTVPILGYESVIIDLPTLSRMEPLEKLDEVFELDSDQECDLRPIDSDDRSVAYSHFCSCVSFSCTLGRMIKMVVHFI